jgi:LysR family transcriptional activator of glutamate synthase operon
MNSVDGVTFRQMEMFVAICRAGSFNKAAAELFVSQQAASKSIRDLEGALKVSLLDRSTKGVTPTKHGVYFYQECLSILRQRAYMVEQVRKMDPSSRESLFLGMSYGVASSLDPAFLADFAEMHPHIKLEYADRPDKQLIEEFCQEAYDLVLAVGPVDREDCNVQMLKRESVNLCIPRTHPLATHSGRLKMEDVAVWEFVMFSHEFNLRDNFLASCRHAGFEPRIGMSSGDFNTLIELAVRTNRLFIVPSHAIRTDDAQVIYTPFPDRLLTWDVMLVTRKNKLITSPIAAFLEFLGP